MTPQYELDKQKIQLKYTSWNDTADNHSKDPSMSGTDTSATTDFLESLEHCSS